jgi:hypothetical protein
MKCWSIPVTVYDLGTPVVQMSWDNADNSIWEVIPFASSVSDKKVKTALHVYYNAGRLNIQSADDSKLVDFYVVNMLGETIRYKRGIGNSAYSLPFDMAPGIYIVKATMAGGLTANIKFVKP